VLKTDGVITASEHTTRQAVPCSSVWLFGFDVTCYGKDDYWQQLFTGVETWKKRDIAHTHVYNMESYCICSDVQYRSRRQRRSSWMRRVGYPVNLSHGLSESTVNSSQRRQTRRSTRHTILGCDELTGSQIITVNFRPYGRKIANWTHNFRPYGRKITFTDYFDHLSLFTVPYLDYSIIRFTTIHESILFLHV